MKDAGVVSAQELHAFADFLQRSEGDMVSLIKTIYTEVYRVSEGWDDKVNAAFVEEFKGHVAQIARLVERMEEHSRFVHKKATAIEYYNQVT